MKQFVVRPVISYVGKELDPFIVLADSRDEACVICSRLTKEIDYGYIGDPWYNVLVYDGERLITTIYQLPTSPLDVKNRKLVKDIAFVVECEVKTEREKKALKCAKETAAWLGEHSLTGDVTIYAGGSKYTVSTCGKLIYEDEANPKDYFEYAGDFMSMSFEGPLYYVLNNYKVPGIDSSKYEKELDKIFKKYGYYYELGDCCSLSLYKL